LYIDEKAKILENKHISGKTWLLRLEAPKIASTVKPAQFVMIKATEDFQYDPLLRRAFAVADVKDKELLIFYDVYGKGTKSITTKKAGEEIYILGALGKKLFPENYDYYLLVGGGIGFAGLSLFMKYLKNIGKPFKAIYGVRRKEQLSMLDWIKENGFENDVIIYTEDGSFGEKGLVTKDLKKFIIGKKNISLAVCGPKKMMKAVVEEVKDLKIPVYLSLESKMACGFGICIGCVIKNIKENTYQRVCYEGPVFNAEEINIEDF